MRILGATIVLLALALPVDADHCTTYSTSHPEVDAAGVYADLDYCQIDNGCLWNLWIYQESNGIPGLQRGGVHAQGGWDDYVDDTCHGMIEPDTMIF